MESQLRKNATCIEIQSAILKWLRARCLHDPFRGFYQEAVKRYLASGGKELLSVGVLMRDTQPNERDLNSVAVKLSTQFEGPARVKLVAWYLPVPQQEWPALL